MSRNTIVRVELEGEVARKFLDLKAYLGLKNNAEVLRHCICECHNSLLRDRKAMRQSGPIDDTGGIASLSLRGAP